MIHSEKDFRRWSNGRGGDGYCTEDDAMSEPCDQFDLEEARNGPSIRVEVWPDGRCRAERTSDTGGVITVVEHQRPEREDCCDGGGT